jgi:hypothetical protein
MLPALAVVLAGCGSSEPSDVQLRNHANAICAAANRKASAISSPSSPDGVPAFLANGATVFSAELERLRALRPPSDIKDVYEASITALAKKVDELELTARRIHSGQDPVVAMKTLQEHLAPLESDEDHAWSALQVSACVNG